MSEPNAGAEPPRKRSKLPLLVGLGLAIVMGGAGFAAVRFGLVPVGGPDKAAHESAPEPVPDIAFVPVAPLVISLGPGGSARHLRFSAQIEVPKAHEPEVALLMPRIVDVLNGYLRAVDVRDLEDPSALIRLRAQILRRVQIVAGEGRVRDFLVTEFVLN